MLDVFDMVEGYCLLTIERINLIQQEKLVFFLIYLCFQSWMCYFFLKILVAQLVDRYLLLSFLIICL